MSDEIQIKLFEGLAGSPALELAVRCWAELQEKGFGDGGIDIHVGLSAFVAFVKEGPVGVMTWSYDDVLKRIWIFHGYTLPEYRGRGIYDALWNQMVAYATTTKATSIQSGTHIRNTAMRAVAKKQGRVEEAVTLRFDL